MKIQFIALLLSLSLYGPQLWAQGQSFTQSTPISISGDGLAGEKGEDEATMKAREELKRSRIKKVETSENSENQNEDEDKEKTDEKKKTPVPEKVSEQPPVKEAEEKEAKQQSSSSWEWAKKLSFKQRPSFIEFSWGPMFSSWSDVSSELKDDSWVTGFAWGRFFHPTLSSSIGIEFVHPQEQQFVVEEVRVFQLSGTLKHHYKFSRNFSLVSGGSLLIADWNVRKKLSTANSQEVYQSFDSGSGVGLRPEASLRWHIGEANRLDLKASWTQYFGTPESDFGGAGLSLQLHIQL